MATCTLSDIQTDICTNSFQALSEEDKLAVILQLLCNISSGGVGGLAGSGDPEGVVVANPGATYLNTDDESFWVKKTGTQTDTGWIELIA